MGHKPTLQEVSIRRVLDGHSFSEAERERLVKDAPAEVYIASPKSTLLPAEIVGNATPDEWLRAAGYALGYDEVAICSAPNDGCVAVVAVSRLLAQTLAQMPKVVVRSLLLLDTVAERGTVLTLYGGCLYVRYYDGGMRFADVVEVASDADICYYLQRIDEVYNIYNIGVRITPENRALAALCRRHFKRVICE